MDWPLHSVEEPSQVYGEEVKVQRLSALKDFVQVRRAASDGPSSSGSSGSTR
jgi:hypothetical protein